VLRELLFRLWGDLEEKKSAYLKTQKEKAAKALEDATRASAMANKPKAFVGKPGDDLPPDSDDESPREGTRPKNSSKVVKERDHTGGSESNSELSEGMSFLPVTNKGFTCCIQQYGIKVPENSRSKADAGEGMRWKRMFALFGTTIA
jgi:protection of telomeres protein 1